MNRSELYTILQQHKEWLKNKEKGKKADLEGADIKGAIVPLYSKWIPCLVDDEIRVGCRVKTAEEWEVWLASDEEYETKRGTQDFKRIEAMIRGAIAYSKVLKS